MAQYHVAGWLKVSQNLIKPVDQNQKIRITPESA
jgi:hypothetical protein